MQRKNYDAAFKGKLALELAKELRTVNEIATEYGVHPSVIAKWKKQLLDGIPTIFSKEIQENNKTEAYEELIARLYQKIGQLEVKLAPCGRTFRSFNSP